jgi:hypothetical protein
LAEEVGSVRQPACGAAAGAADVVGHAAPAAASEITDALVELLIRGKAIKTVLESQIVEILLEDR